ncbi:peptidylprolyl isomerase [Adlercreutzia sp. R25]|uniref:Peptidylprolyl isomerase n=1 Tax=Adlercreutzia shanghongiae TaxID=3111773 RepID=A0ABU6IZJ6_9ACTN|nr:MULTISPECIES: peptidylprolyl isomerase [unclassified Adlercreutzia]MEC4273016.1 peptidylprolyl isomerase [Adlercreutzia sp. R25]MEC4295193.1 peptidylprolyl isomerase [Adlercreutzia sp. R22]
MNFTSFKSSALKSVGAVSLCVALGAGLVGCGGGEGGAGGAVAATVNGQQIMEQTITDYIADFRTNTSLETDEAWGEWMVTNGYTPESVRDEVIDYYINQNLYDQAAQEYGVAVEDADITAAMDETKAMFESEEAFQEALQASNMTEESYIEDVIRPNLLQTKLAEAVAEQEGGNAEGDDATLAQAQAMSEQFNGAKRSSHILLTGEEGEEDEALAARAQQLLDQINAGEITFEDAAAQYSTDTGSAANGGDVGWDALTTFVTEYQDALNGLEKDQIVAAPVKSEYGYHIIKVTDVFEVPEGGITSLDQVPAEFQEYLAYMQQSDDTQNFTAWFEEYRNNATIEINPMPEGLPYDIDLTPYEEQAAADAAAAEDAANADATAEPTTDDQAAADAAAADAAADEAAADQAAADEAGADAAADDAAGDQAAADQAADDAAADQTAADEAGADAAADDQAAGEGEAAQQ